MDIFDQKYGRRYVETRREHRAPGTAASGRRTRCRSSHRWRDVGADVVSAKRDNHGAEGRPSAADPHVERHETDPRRVVASLHGQAGRQKPLDLLRIEPPVQEGQVLHQWIIDARSTGVSQVGRTRRSHAKYGAGGGQGRAARDRHRQSSQRLAPLAGVFVHGQVYLTIFGLLLYAVLFMFFAGVLRARLREVGSDWLASVVFGGAIVYTTGLGIFAMAQSR